MSRPKVVGEPISLRLPVRLDREVREEAERRGVSPGIYLSRVVSRALTQPRKEEQEGRAAGDVRVAEASGETVGRSGETRGAVRACRHSRPTKLAYGPWMCPDCGAITNDRGLTWRR